MSGDQKTWSLVAVILCVTLIAVVALMAQCAIKVDGTQVDAAECSKHGGIWHPSADPASRFCEEPHK